MISEGRKPMLIYYALYRDTAGQGPPVGIFILEEQTGDALLWSHRATAWRRDAELVERVLGDSENWDRIERVSRDAAEHVTMMVTRTEFALPDEETLRWLMRKGDRP